MVPDPPPPLYTTVNLFASHVYDDVIPVEPFLLYPVLQVLIEQTLYAVVLENEGLFQLATPVLCGHVSEQVRLPFVVVGTGVVVPSVHAEQVVRPISSVTDELEYVPWGHKSQLSVEP